MLHDWLVVRVTDNHIQRGMLTEGDLSLDWTMELALRLEAAAKNAQAIQGVCLLGMDRSTRGEVDKIITKQQSAAGSDPCYHCGGSQHSLAQRKHKKARYFNCGKTGHLARVCWLGKDPKQSTRSVPTGYSTE